MIQRNSSLWIECIKVPYQIILNFNKLQLAHIAVSELGFQKKLFYSYLSKSCQQLNWKNVVSVCLNKFKQRNHFVYVLTRYF